MWITIYCDASFKEGESGGGYWIKSSVKRIIDSAILTNRLITNNNLAELAIAAVAINKAIQAHKDHKIVGILLVSDSLYCLNSLKKDTKISENIVTRHYQERVHNLLNSMNIRIRVKHQKGHSGKSTISSYLNHRVDKLSRQYMK